MPLEWITFLFIFPAVGLGFMFAIFSDEGQLQIAKFQKKRALNREFYQLVDQFTAQTKSDISDLEDTIIRLERENTYESFNFPPQGKENSESRKNNPSTS